MMGDDGEKFGAWPTTWEHCWGKGRWVERFFEALEANADWLTTVRPSDWLASNPPIGRVYVPTGSYSEMGEWALPPAESRAFGAALRHARETEAPEARWLRGAFWRNFQVKYREVNDLHKQMLRASDAVEAMPPGPPRDAALDHLYRGQSNDCYWHGLFGGIYIAHMRAATLAHLIAAEDLADAARGTLARSETRDLDLDGRDEVLLANEGEVVTVDLDEGAGIGAWDLRAARHAIAAVLRRRPEAYHETLREHDAAPPLAGGAASIHDRVEVKEAGLAAHLVYDDYERRSGLVRILPPDATAEAWGAGGRGELGDLVAGPFRLVGRDADSVVVARDGSATMAGHAIPLSVETRMRLGGGRLDPGLDWSTTIENRGDAPLVARVGVEWATTMLGGGGNPDAWWEIGGERSAHDCSGAANEVTALRQGNAWLGTEVATVVAPAADAWHAPIETVSNSEAGFERVYQGSALLLSWVIRLEPGAAFTATVQHRATVVVDRRPENPSARGLRATG
jgi:alpha-amylase